MNQRILFLFFLLLSSSAFTQQIPKPKPERRPSVGLVLSGGGAKGFAYVGMLRVLEEVNMPIDYIGGTSIGAVIGSLYALGYSADTIEYLIRQQDWDQVISSRIERKYLSYEEKLYAEKYQLTVPFKQNKIELGGALTPSLHIDMLLNRFMSPAFGIQDFDSLNTPFVCMGTELMTGEPVEMRHGNLARAVRASMAIPGYFPLVEYEGKYLVDGGVVNNYPAVQVKDMGADIIIGGDVQSKKVKRVEELYDLPKLFDHIMAYSRDEANELGYALTDIYMQFEMDYDIMSFSSYDSIMALGERVARQHYTELKTLADSLNAMEPLVNPQKQLQPLKEIQTKGMRVLGNPKYDKYLSKDFVDEIEQGEIALDELEESILYLYGTKNFRNIFYTYDDQNITIHLDTVGDATLGAGIHYDTDYGGSILANITVRNVLHTRSKLFSDLVLGENPRWKNLWILNNGLKPGFALESDLYSFQLPVYSNGEKLQNLRLRNFSLGAYIPITFRNSLMFKVGAQYDAMKYVQDIIRDTNLVLADKYHHYGSIYTSLDYDSRDKLVFPTQGALIEMKAKYVALSNEFTKGPQHNTFAYYVKANRNFPLGKHWVLRPGVFGGYVHSGEYEFIQHIYGLGGLNPSNYIESYVPFTGYRFVEKFANYAAIARMKVQYEPFRNIYLTAMFDYGFAETAREELMARNAMFGYGLKGSYNSFIGPIELSVMYASETKLVSLFLNVGFWF